MTHDDFDPDVWQAARDAIDADDLIGLRTLLDKNKGLINVCSTMGSCLHFAAEESRLELVQLLVERGANVNACAEVGGPPLACAASEGHAVVLRYLLANGARLDVSTPDRNPLFAAIHGGYDEVAKILLEAGIDPNVVYRGQSGKLRNALSFARRCGQTQIADVLIKCGCRLPIEGVDKPAWEPEKLYKPTPEDKAHEQIITFMADLFGPVDPLAMQEIAPVHDDVHVAINVIPPNEKVPYLTLFTTGMSDRAMKVPPGQEKYKCAELFMQLPPTWPHPRTEGLGREALWPLQWLRKVAYYPHLNETWLGGPTTIISSDDPPLPLGPNTKQTCLLLLADFAKWSPMILDDGKSVHFYTVFPIYTEERDFEKQQGMLPLLQRLQEHGYAAVVDVDRENVASA